MEDKLVTLINKQKDAVVQYRNEAFRYQADNNENKAYYLQGKADGVEIAIYHLEKLLHEENKNGPTK